MKYLKPYNESITHLLKPKSKEDILKLSKKLSPDEKLLYGAKYGILEFVKSALKSSSRFILFIDRITDDDIQGALNFACFHGNLEIVKYLIENKIVNLKENDGRCFLSACDNGQFEVVKYLLEQDDIIYGTSTRNWERSIFLLKEYGYKHILDYINKFDMFPKMDESIRHLLKPRSKEDILKSIEKLDHNEKLVKGALYGILSIVKDVMIDDKFTNILDDNDYFQAFSNACSNGHVDIVEYLLQFKNFSILFAHSHAEWAYRDKDWKMLDVLLKDDRITKELTPYELDLYTDRVNYELRNIKESIRSLLKPISKDNILKNIEGKSNIEKFIISIKYNLDWLYDITKDEVKTVQISVEEHDDLEKGKFLSFDYVEKSLINNNIGTDDKKERKYYIFDDEHSLYINHKKGWYIDKYEKYILVKINYNDRMETFIYYVCPNIYHLIDLLKKYSIEAREYDPTKKEFIDN